MNTALLRQSFALVVDRNPAVVSRFYEILFTRHPQAKPLFAHTSPAAQSAMLTRALVAVVEHLEDPVWLSSTLTQLGARHVGYGVTDEMYDWVGESLLAALAEVAGSDWTDEMAGAWGAAFGFIAGTMKEGARLAQARTAVA